MGAGTSRPRAYAGVGMTHGGDEGCDEGVFNDGFGAGDDRPGFKSRAPTNSRWPI
jgi:hypothetical protein